MTYEEIKKEPTSLIKGLIKGIGRLTNLLLTATNPVNSRRSIWTNAAIILILITLKGHLIIEHLLEMNLCRLLGIDRLPKEKEDNYPELEFIHKLKLLQAVTVGSKPGPNTDLFKAIAKLNKIRNRLVHNLKNAKEIEADVKSVIDCYQSKADKKLSLGEPLPAQLKSCIYKLCRFLDSVNVHFHRLKWDII